MGAKRELADGSSEHPAATEVVAGRAEPGHVQQFRLGVVAGPDRDVVFTSEGIRVVVGTHGSADLVLTDPTVSRFHCEITLDAEAPRVRDLGSRNGTRINGVSVVEARVTDGDVLVLGRSEVRFELAEREIEIPLAERERFGRLVGRSVTMRSVFWHLERAAASDATVLLSGETGTGKDAAAESIHDESNRRDGPFVIVDCAAIPAGLIESELFGHEKGSFTGAERDKEGAFEAAAGGTLFLDEIGDLALPLQPKLLRVIETRAIQRVGSTKRIPVDVRVVAATNRSLCQDVNAKRFRSDLYYRLAVIEVTMPPLRERLEDLPVLVEELLDAMGRTDAATQAALLAPQFLSRLLPHPWPGNVRELRNHLERCLALDTSLAPTAVTAAYDDAPRIDPDVPLREVRESWVRFVERRYLQAVLEKHGGNVTHAARAAGVARVHFYRLLDRVKGR